MINFYPVWITPEGNLPSVTENESVTYVLEASQIALFMAKQNQQTIYCGNNASIITDVKINTIDTIDYSISGEHVNFINPLSASDIIQFTTSQSLTFSILYNTLPPGLSISSTGTISGTVGILPSDGTPVTYTFGVRVSDGTNSRDRQFTIVGTPASANITPPGWGTLPSLQVQQETSQSFTYVPLGSTTRGVPFEFQLSLFLPTGRFPELVLQDFLGSSSIEAPFNSFPTGLTLNTSTGLITGAVSTAAPLGNYFFNINMLDSFGNAITVGTGAYPITCGIDVIGLSQPLQPLNFIIWTTPSGSLASVYEGQPFPIGVLATSTTGSAITYTLNQSTPLPPGLSLDSSTGYIEGIVGHVGQDTTYNFTIRASSGQAFLDQNFSITVLNRYNSPDFLNISFILSANDTIPLQTYYSSVVPSQSIFRPTDINFSSVLNSGIIKILLVGGLNGNLIELQTIIRNSNFDGPITVYLGSHKIAYAKLNNEIIYEVLYRDVIDPLLGAGGYTVTNGVPTANPLYYPESNPATPTYFYPPSLANLRNEFVSDIGFPTLNTALTNNLSLSGGSENLPLWMTSPQVGNDTTTALGYIPAIALAYLLPGTGQAVLNSITNRPADPDNPTDISDPVTVGHEVDLEQYYIDFQTLANQTTFDGETTNFDSSTTLFDGFAESGSDLFRMNRARFNLTTS
jgi:hypothetical protein